MFYNDAIGAVVNGISQVLGYAATLAIILTGIWRATFWCCKQAKTIWQSMKAEWKEATE